jgi:hypothetical protein
MRNLLFTALLIVLAGGACAAGTSTVAVTYGGGHGNACPVNGTVEARLIPLGSMIDVRSGPGAKYKTIDRIETYQPIAICDPQGEWFGIVYSKAREDCGTTRPVAPRQTYAGPCASGWVESKYIREHPG